MAKEIVMYHTVEYSNENEHAMALYKNMPESHKNNIQDG